MKKKKEYLILDGYNIIHSWGNLKQTALSSLENARIELIEIMSNYQGYKQIEVIIVFDAHKIKGNHGTHEKHNNINVVYTKESQTADSYIERFSALNAKSFKVRVATSDNLEQIIILGQGAMRLSANDLYEEIKQVKKEIKEKFIQNKPIKNNMLFDNLDPETARILNEMRMNNKKGE